MERSASEYREYAKQAFMWANTARTEQEREGFLDLARTWALAAQRLQQTEAKAA